LPSRKQPSIFKIEIPASEVDRETRRARAAFRLASSQLNKLRSESETSSVPGIFDAQRAMIEESSLLEKVVETVAEQKVNAEWAVKIVTDGYIDKYKSIADEHLRDRYIDLEDVADRILNALGGGERAAPLAKDSIIVAQELMPSTLAEQSGNHPTAVITEHGGVDIAHIHPRTRVEPPAVTGVRKVSAARQHGRRGDRRWL
jgi:phosphotransferase system enzyme I (PtsI)